MEQGAFIGRALRILGSVLCPALLLVVLRLSTAIDETTVAPLLVVEILLVARWGRVEAYSSAVVAALGLDFFFLPPPGFGVSGTDQVVPFGVFAATAGFAGHFARGYPTGLLRSLAQKTRCFMTHAHLPGRFSAKALTDKMLLQSVVTDASVRDLNTGVAVLPIRRAGQAVASLAIPDGGFSAALTERIGVKVGIALARAETAQKELRAEIARRDEELNSAILGSVLHEIKSPLAAIRGAASTLLSVNPRSKEQSRGSIGTLRDETVRLSGNVDEAMKMARLQACQTVLEPKPSDVRGIVFHSLEETALFLGASKAAFRRKPCTRRAMRL